MSFYHCSPRMARKHALPSSLSSPSSPSSLSSLSSPSSPSSPSSLSSPSSFSAPLASSSSLSATSKISLCVLLLSVAVYVLVSFSYSQSISDGPANFSPGPPTRLMIAARKGNLAEVKKLLMEDDPRALDPRGYTVIHIVLEARHNTIMNNLGRDMHGEYEDILAEILKHPLVDVTTMCPIYYAVHFRQYSSMKMIVNHMRKEDLIDCLTEQDAMLDTALHSAIASKASGFARFFVRTYTQLNSLENKNKINTPAMKLHAIHGLPPVWRGDAFRLVDMHNVIGDDDILFLLPFLNSSHINILGSGNNTLLHIAAFAGKRPETLKALLARGANINTSNIYGQTPLHQAAASGLPESLDTLIDFGGKLDAKDNLNRKPFDIALELGHPFALAAILKRLNSKERLSLVEQVFQSLQERHLIKEANLLANLLALPLPSQSKQYSNQNTPRKTHSTNGGWDTEIDRLPNDMQPCHIVQKDAKDINETTFFEEFSSIQRPLLIKGGAEGWAASKKWRRNDFLNSYGDIHFSVGPVPYADIYGMGRQKSMNARDFINVHMGKNRPSGAYPSYVFDAGILFKNDSLAQDVPFDFLGNHPHVLKQFMLGPRGTGAPPHFHGSAANALIYGEKKWFLFPPDSAFFVIRHIKKWIEDDLDSLRRDPDVRILECTQEAGDILVVPHMWGHAVLNQMDTIAVAVEFRE